MEQIAAVIHHFAAKGRWGRVATPKALAAMACVNTVGIRSNPKK
jgi:hypothetical protein